ncbi:MAG: hypothetical protein JWN51_1969 [Phycisphaerales bacterium]|nr:hypothetical protein [Phycisphaerales bacterium]
MSHSPIKFRSNFNFLSVLFVASVAFVSVP